MIQLTTSFMFVENVKQVVKHALMILLALHLIIGHLGNLILILHIHYAQLPGRLFSPSNICKKLSHHFLLHFPIGMGS